MSENATGVSGSATPNGTPTDSCGIPIVTSKRVPPGEMRLRSMSQFEMRLRRHAGADRRWALVLLAMCERWWLRG